MGVQTSTASVAFANGYHGKQVWMDYTAPILNAKLYMKKGINCNANLSVSVDGASLTYWTQVDAGVKTDDLGQLHTAAAGQIKGLKPRTVHITKGEIIDILIPAANMLAPNVGETYYAQAIMSAANRINESFVKRVEAGSATIDAAGKVGAVTVNSGLGILAVAADSGYSDATSLKYDSTKPFESIAALMAAFKKRNADSAFRPTSLLVSSAVYADLLVKNLLIFKSIGGEEVYTFLGMDVTEVPELTVPVIMFHRDAVFGAANLNFVVENAMDPSVPGGLSIKGELGHEEGVSDFGESFKGRLILKLAPAAA